MKIDLVLTWVDGNDPKWQAEYKKFSNVVYDGRRYRDWELLKYWFRSIEKNLPFVDKIFFVTYGHIPEWLNSKHPMLRIVKHSDFMPKKYLPTFNSVPIELNLHRIEGLGANFIYFNDDCFILQPMQISDYLVKNKIKFNYVESAMAMYGELDAVHRDMLINTNNLINARFKKHVVRGIFQKDFNAVVNNLKAAGFRKYIGYAPHHFSKVFRKATLDELWKKEPTAMEQSSLAKFRSGDTITSDIVELWQYCKGQTVSYNHNPREKYFGVSKDNLDAIAEHILRRSTKEVCLNDTCSDEEYEDCKSKLQACFEVIFPEKSSFEK